MADLPNNPPAFPQGEWAFRVGDGREGMTLRDWFAGQAIANPNLLALKPQAAAEHAYRIADAMLLARQDGAASDRGGEHGI